MTRPRRVVILQREVKHYRREVFEELATALRRHDVELQVAYSAPSPRERAKADNVELAPPLGVEVRARWLAGERLLYQDAWEVVRSADLVIVAQESKQLFPYALLLLSGLGRKRVAFWGHGYNHQGRPSLAEWWKRQLVPRVDWWFAYTQGVADYVAGAGMPADRITVLHNTVDTRPLRRAVLEVTGAQRERVRADLGLAADAQVMLFCGSLYPGKRLDLVLAAAARLRERNPAFELVVVGDGPSRPEVEAAAARSPHVHYAGTAFGDARAPYFAIADVFIMPAYVGVAVVDAFAAGIPVISSPLPGHGPEFEYLVDGDNAVIVPPTAAALADATARLLADPARLARLRDGARRRGEELVLPRMVGAFATGILGCLARDDR